MRITIEEIQRKIQNLKSDYKNAALLQKLFHDAAELIGYIDEESKSKIMLCRDELNFYLEGGSDNLVRYYKCKSEVLTIIAKKQLL
jgi:hypothetical protein